MEYVGCLEEENSTKLPCKGPIYDEKWANTFILLEESNDLFLFERAR